MFDRLRFKRYYTAFKRENHDLSEGWSISLRKSYQLACHLPVKVISKFDQTEIRYLKQFSALAYHPNVMELLESCRAATQAMVEGSYIESDPDEPTSVQLDQWVQPTTLACNFQLLISDMVSALGDFTNAYDNVDESKAGYYSRKTFHITHDMFSLTELLSELVLWDRG